MNPTPPPTPPPLTDQQKALRNINRMVREIHAAIGGQVADEALAAITTVLSQVATGEPNGTISMAVSAGPQSTDLAVKAFMLCTVRTDIAIAVLNVLPQFGYAVNAEILARMPVTPNQSKGPTTDYDA